MAKTKLIALSAGGTAGHLFPALALANQLKNDGYEIVLYTDKRGKNFDKDFPTDKIITLQSATIFNKNLITLLSSIFFLIFGCFQALFFMLIRRPKIIVGFGGYPSIPAAFAAFLLFIPVIIHEQNSVMGRANRLVFYWSKLVASSFPKIKNLPASASNKIIYTGNPVREKIKKASNIKYKKPKGASNKFNLLIFGGSQGAKIFYDVIPDAIASLDKSMQNQLFITQQCRKDEVSSLTEKYQKLGISANVSNFYDNMDELMANSQLIIARSGASTISELTVIGRPAILVPLPGAIDNDQLNNARFLNDNEAAWIIEQKTFDIKSLATRLNELISNSDKLKKYANNAKKYGNKDADIKLKELVIANI